MTRTGRARRWSKRLLVLVAALAVAALAAEAAVLLTLGEQPKFPRRVVGAEFGLRINEPGAVYFHDSADVRVEFRINSRGLRDDREHSYEKPPGRLRIVSLGDSFTVGYEVEVEQCFSSVLERRLRAAGCSVDVLNAGVSGYSNAEEMLYLERELLRYEPDLVVLSFYANDLVDNVRSGLFRLTEDGELVEAAPSYVPAGGLGDFLNTNPVFNWLSANSNAFVVLKEAATAFAKRRIVAHNVDVLGAAESGAADERAEHERRLAAAILERVHATCAERGIPLVVHSIPAYRLGPERLVDALPVEHLDLAGPGIHVLSAKEVLDPYVGREPLFHTRSHWHWTPFAHERAGEALARLVLERGLLPCGGAEEKGPGAARETASGDEEVPP